MQAYVIRKIHMAARTAGLRLRPGMPMWDDGKWEMKIGEHKVTVATHNHNVDLAILHGNATDESWCIDVKVEVHRGVDKLARLERKGEP